MIFLKHYTKFVTRNCYVLKLSRIQISESTAKFVMKIEHLDVLLYLRLVVSELPQSPTELFSPCILHPATLARHENNRNQLVHPSNADNLPKPSPNYPAKRKR